MKVNFGQLDRSYIKYKREFDKTINDVLKSGWFILGKKLKEFEVSFSDFIGSKYCVGLNSGLDALYFGLRALGIGNGDEVIVQANTFIASVLSITNNGAKPVFIEPDEFYNIDVSKIEEKITDKTRAILVVHLYGQSSNMEYISEICKKYKLYLIEDCAQSHGAKFNSIITGGWGDIGCFSFYPTKNIGAFGDAGAIVTNNRDIYEKVNLLRNYGSKIKYRHEVVGGNSRMDEIQAAILNIKLSHYAEILSNRKRVTERYLKNIQNDRIILPQIRKKAESVWHQFVIRVDGREKFQKYLLENNIITQIHYPIPPHLSKCYKYLGYEKGDYPITELYTDTILSLPLFDGITDDEIDYVIENINKYKN
jgi:dTDP-4-amino-4,6-dideoxygalactose transaminase